MKKSIGLWQLVGFATSTLFGTLLHFLYDWTGKSLWIAPFSGVNESTWEHMKLLFWPLLLFAIVESFFFRDRENFWCIKARGISLGLILIPVLFYTYNGVIGKSPDWINIAIFFLSAMLAFLYETHLFHQNDLRCKAPKLSFIFLIAIATLFVLFTFLPPKLPLFQDPITSTYGI